MLAQISTQQFNEWRAYADLEPFDEERADLRAGQIVQTLLNIHRKKGRPPVKLKDCTLQFTAPIQDEDEAVRARRQIRATMDFLTALYPPEKNKG